MNDGWTLDGDEIDPEIDKEGFRVFHADDELEYVDVVGLDLDDLLDTEDDVVRYRATDRVSFDSEDEWGVYE